VSAGDLSSGFCGFRQVEGGFIVPGNAWGGVFCFPSWIQAFPRLLGTDILNE